VSVAPHHLLDVAAERDDVDPREDAARVARRRLDADHLQKISRE